MYKDNNRITGVFFFYINKVSPVIDVKYIIYFKYLKVHFIAFSMDSIQIHFLFAILFRFSESTAYCPYDCRKKAIFMPWFKQHRDFLLHTQRCNAPHFTIMAIVQLNRRYWRYEMRTLNVTSTNEGVSILFREVNKRRLFWKRYIIFAS